MAMVVIDEGISMDTTEIITKEDARRSSRSRLSVGNEITVHDLLHAALMNSDNRAARALARVTSGTIEQFVNLMNRKVRKLGLKKTNLYEPTGLDSRNISTAHEVAKILHYAYDYDLIAKITSSKTYQVKIRNKKNKFVQMDNTNMMVHSRYKVLGGKTGFTRAADHCLTTLIRNKEGERLTVVVLGVPGDRLRFRESRKLADWGFGHI
jgi:D-alanyl-D-alanine endopeptidase (penicillin-binding protein 7)